MKRKLLVIKALFKGKPVEAVMQSDAEYITVRNGNTVRNLSQVLDSINKEINSLNSFKRTFGFTKQDNVAMDCLKNMIDYMEDKDNASEIMNQLKNINNKIELLEEAQSKLSDNITNLAEALTILQEDLNDRNEITDVPGVSPDDTDSETSDKSDETEETKEDNDLTNNSNIEMTMKDIDDGE